MTHESLRQEILTKLASPDCPSLSEEERQVLNQRWGAEKNEVLTLEKVAIKTGMSREVVRQIEQQALLRLRG